MEQKKKPTNAQLQRRLTNAIVHVDKTKDTKEIYFQDKGLHLVVNEDYAVIETNYHRHVYNNVTSGGVSRPYLYTQRFIEIALDNDCKVEGAYSYAKLFETLKGKEKKDEYNIAWYYDLFLNNIFAPLYSIDESVAGSFLVYEDYLHNVARNAVVLSEKTEPMTNKQFFDKVIENMKSYVEGMEEHVVFEKKTDEERMKETIEALDEQENEDFLKSQEKND